MKTLSIRQPWAWLIVNGYKTVENRSRSLGNHTAPLLIHASTKMTFADYEACQIFMRAHEPLRSMLQFLPPASSTKFHLGGIVGMVDVKAKIENWPGIFKSESIDAAWYTGEVGYWLANPIELPFLPCKGRLGFFDVDYVGLSS